MVINILEKINGMIVINTILYKKILYINKTIIYQENNYISTKQLYINKTIIHPQ